jgi:flagella basal body P-ring formation protein FlgA
MIWQWTRPGTPSNTFDTMIKRMIVDTRENQYLDVLTSRWQVVVARRYIEQGHMLNISDLKLQRLQRLQSQNRKIPATTTTITGLPCFLPVFVSTQ